MPKVSQSGFAHIVLVVILVLGLIAGTYLVQQRTNFLPQAAKNKSELSKSQLKKKIKKESLQKYSEAKIKYLKAKDENKEDEQIEGSSEMVVSATQYETDINALKKHDKKKNNKNKKLIDNLDKYNKKVQKEIKIVLAHNKKIKNKDKYNKAIEKFKNKKKELLSQSQIQLENGDTKDLKVTDDELIDQSMGEGITVAQKEAFTELSFIQDLLNIFIPSTFARPAVDPSDAQIKAKEAEEKLNKIKDKMADLANLRGGAIQTGVPVSDLNHARAQQQQEMLEAAYDYGYALGQSLSISEIDDALSEIELDRATPEEREIAAGLQRAKDEKAAEEAAAAAPPADAPPAAAPGVEAPSEEEVDGTENPGIDNPGLE